MTQAPTDTPEPRTPDRAAAESAVVPRLLDQVRHALRVRHYSYRTEEAYVGWIRRFIRFHGKRHPAEMGTCAKKDSLPCASTPRGRARGGVVSLAFIVHLG